MHHQVRTGQVASVDRILREHARPSDVPLTGTARLKAATPYLGCGVPQLQSLPR